MFEEMHVLEQKLAAAEARIAELEVEQEEDHDLRAQMSDILTRVANILKGPPPKLTLHSWHDLPEVLEKRIKEVSAGK